MTKNPNNFMVFENSTHPQDYNEKKSNIDKKIVSLIVSEADSRDVGRGIARIDPKVAKEYNIETGDALEISSEKSKSLVLYWMAYPEDYRKGLIRIDGYIRNKLGIGVNDKVKVRRIDVSKAKHMLLAEDVDILHLADII